MSRTAIRGRSLSMGEMAYTLNHAGLTWRQVQWVLGHTYPRTTQTLARQTATWGGLPWIEGYAPPMSQRGLLMGWTRKYKGYDVTHGQILAQVAEALVQHGILGIIMAGNRTKGCRTYVLRMLGCSWKAVADIMGGHRSNTAVASARRFGARTDGIPRLPPVVQKDLGEKGRLIYEAFRDTGKTWQEVADDFGMSAPGVIASAKVWASETGAKWPIRGIRQNSGTTAYHRHVELGTWHKVADDMDYAYPSSAYGVAHNWWEREGRDLGYPWPPGPCEGENGATA